MRYNTVKSHHFTLTELMVVVVIVAIVMALVVPAFNSMGAGTAVDSAARMVSAQLMLARNEAISRRKTVAVVMPADTITQDANDTNVYKYQSFRSGILDASTNKLEKWVDGTEWAFLPNKAVIATVSVTLPGLITPSGESYVLASSPSLTEDTGVSGPITAEDGGERILDGVTNSSGIRAIAFKSNGSLTTTSAVYITIVEAINNNGSLQKQDPLRNFRVIEVNPYTGKARFIY